MTISDKVLVYNDIIRRNTEKFGDRKIGVAIRAALFILEKKIEKEDLAKIVFKKNSKKSDPRGSKTSCSVLLYDQDYLRLCKIREKFKGVELHRVIRLGMEAYLDEFDLLPESFERNQYRKEIAIDGTQYAIITQRYGKTFVPAAIRTAISFFIEGYEHMEPWADVSTLTSNDRKFFDLKTSYGPKNLGQSHLVKINCYKQERLDLEVLEEDFGIPRNEMIRVCLDRFLNLPGWSQREIIKHREFSKKKLSPEEPSIQITISIPEEIEKELRSLSPNGKIQIASRDAIAKYLESSKYKDKDIPNPDHERSYVGNSGVVYKQTGIHLIKSQAIKLKIVATWEDISRNELINKIFQDYICKQAV